MKISDLIPKGSRYSSIRSKKGLRFRMGVPLRRDLGGISADAYQRSDHLETLEDHIYALSQMNIIRDHGRVLNKYSPMTRNLIVAWGAYHATATVLENQHIYGKADYDAAMKRLRQKHFTPDNSPEDIVGLIHEMILNPSLVGDMGQVEKIFTAIDTKIKPYIGGTEELDDERAGLIKQMMNIAHRVQYLLMRRKFSHAARILEALEEVASHDEKCSSSSLQEKLREITSPPKKAKESEPLPLRDPKEIEDPSDTWSPVEWRPHLWPNTPDAHWAPMHVEELPMDHQSRAMRTVKRYRPDYIGPLRYIHRALLPSGDGRCMGMRRRISGGTVLIDCSGSMSLSTEEIIAMVHATPNTTIALYSSMKRNNDNGILVIAGRGGRVATAAELRQVRDSRMGSGNVCDGLALRWMSKQVRPHYWISDGQVTGRGEHSGDSLVEDCARIMKAQSIKRFRTIEDLRNYRYSIKCGGHIAAA